MSADSNLPTLCLLPVSADWCVLSVARFRPNFLSTQNLISSSPTSSLLLLSVHPSPHKQLQLQKTNPRRPLNLSKVSPTLNSLHQCPVSCQSQLPATISLPTVAMMQVSALSSLSTLLLAASTARSFSSAHSRETPPTQTFLHLSDPDSTHTTLGHCKMLWTFPVCAHIHGQYVPI